MKFVHWLFLIAVVSVFSVVMGCTEPPKDILDQQYSAAYAEGFNDGCWSGRKAAGESGSRYRKDERRFQIESQYRRGWNDGFRQCKGEQEVIDRQMHMEPEERRPREGHQDRETSGKNRMEEGGKKEKPADGSSGS